jgi:hypothetical protein
MPPGGIRTRNPCKLVAANRRLRPHCHRYPTTVILRNTNFYNDVLEACRNLRFGGSRIAGSRIGRRKLQDFTLPNVFLPLFLFDAFLPILFSSFSFRTLCHGPACGFVSVSPLRVLYPAFFCATYIIRSEDGGNTTYQRSIKLCQSARRRIR